MAGGGPHADPGEVRGKSGWWRGRAPPAELLTASRSAEPEVRPLHHALCGARSPSRRCAGEVICPYSNGGKSSSMWPSRKSKTAALVRAWGMAEKWSQPGITWPRPCGKIAARTFRVAGAGVAGAGHHQGGHGHLPERLVIEGHVADPGDGGQGLAVLALFVGELAEGPQHLVADGRRIFGQHGVGHRLARHVREPSPGACRRPRPGSGARAGWAGPRRVPGPCGCPWSSRTCPPARRPARPSG